MHALHDVPMITLYNHKRVIWHAFNLLQCVIFCNILDMLPRLWEMVTGKVPLINWLTCTYNLILFSNILLTVTHSWFNLGLPCTLTIRSYKILNTLGEHYVMNLTPFLDRSGVFYFIWYRLYIWISQILSRPQYMGFYIISKNRHYLM